MADPAASDPNNPTSENPSATVTPTMGTADATSEKPAGTTPRPGQ